MKNRIPLRYEKIKKGLKKSYKAPQWVISKVKRRPFIFISLSVCIALFTYGYFFYSTIDNNIKIIEESFEKVKDLEIKVNVLTNKIGASSGKINELSVDRKILSLREDAHTFFATAQLPFDPCYNRTNE